MSDPLREQRWDVASVQAFLRATGNPMSGSGTSEPLSAQAASGWTRCLKENDAITKPHGALRSTVLGRASAAQRQRSERFPDCSEGITKLLCQDPPSH